MYKIIDSEKTIFAGDDAILFSFFGKSQGQVSASHLNGELGEVRNVKQDESGNIRLEVCFEKKGLIKQKNGNTVLVKLENLRIAFDYQMLIR